MSDDKKLSKSARRRKNKKRKETEVTLEIQNMVVTMGSNVLNKPVKPQNSGDKNG